MPSLTETQTLCNSLFISNSMNFEHQTDSEGVGMIAHVLSLDFFCSTGAFVDWWNAMWF